MKTANGKKVTKKTDKSIIKIKDVLRYSKLFFFSDGTCKVNDIDSVICSDNGGITWFSGGTTRQWQENITFPYVPLIEPKRVYIEYTEDVPLGFTGDKFEIITEDKDRIKALYEKKRKEFDDAER